MRKITSRLPLIGGRLTVSAPALGAKLERISGTPPPWTSVRIPAGTTVTYTATYRGLAPSAGEGDVVVSARFVPDGGDTISRTASATSVKLELRAVYEAPANPCVNRHVYGVGEKVRVTITPALSSVKVKSVKGDTNDIGAGSTPYDSFGGQAEVNGSEVRTYTCPISSSYIPDVTVNYSGVQYRPSFEIVDPQSVVTPSASWGENAVELDRYFENRKCWSNGMVGSAALVTTNYIGPMHVSFQGIAVSEVPCRIEDVITGCFTNSLVEYRTHTKTAGAGKAHCIKEGNFWFVDGARSGGDVPNWQPESRMIWKIPIGWHRKSTSLPEGYDWHGVEEVDYERCNDDRSRPLLIGNRIDAYKQERYIDADGVYRTDKFGHWISRSRWCQVVLDGVILQRRHSQ